MSLLIKNGIVIPMEDKRIINKGAVFVNEDRIIEVGKTNVLEKKYRAEQVIDASWKLVLPGFIDAHDHIDGMVLARNVGVDLPLVEMLQTIKWPLLTNMGETDFYLGSLIGYIDRIRTGATTIANNYYGPKGLNTDGVAQAALDSGARVLLVWEYSDSQASPGHPPEEFLWSQKEVLNEYSRLFRQWHHKGEGKLTVWGSPVDLPICSPETIIKVAALVRKYGSGLQTHADESKEEIAMVKKKFNGLSYLEVFHNLGVLNTLFSAAHCVWINPQEIKYLRQAGASVVHNPLSNNYIAGGIAPIATMLQKGVNVALGADGYMGMIEEMRHAINLQRIKMKNNPRSKRVLFYQHLNRRFFQNLLIA
ncbi:MAG: amidohydrolase family protein [Candidatus Hodarchaeota archaeon]